MKLCCQLPSIQEVKSEVAHSAGVDLSVLRLDCLHPWISGNKWYKLKYNLLAAKQENYTTLLTFGGAYSNHIFATAAVGNECGFRTIGVIRGEEYLPLNPTLSFAVIQGMELIYLNRESYRRKNTKELQAELRQRFGEVFIIPEGGSNLNGVRGCREIVQDRDRFNVICLACGTGTTLAGIALGLHPSQRVIGFPVMKQGEFLASEIAHLITSYQASGLPGCDKPPAFWQLVCDYHFGGYAKVNQQLLKFADQFSSQGLLLDYVYTAKMFYGVIDLLEQGKLFRPGDRILLIHTGGLQGNMGMAKYKINY